MIWSGVAFQKRNRPCGHGGCQRGNWLERLSALVYARRMRSVLLFGLAPFVLTGCGTAAATAPSQPAQSDLGRFLVSQPANKTAVLKLAAADGNANGGYNFDGYANGQLVFTVPVGWTVQAQLSNSGLMPHSAVIISQQAQQSNNVSIPAFPGAETLQPAQGISMGAVAHFSFKASKSGVYAIACGVSGHDADGMWDTLVVSAAAKAPTVTVKP